ncbi:MAG: hypothetical protein AB1461_14205 [Thermodesulfobacteriota bacterium]
MGYLAAGKSIEESDCAGKKILPDLSGIINLSGQIDLIISGWVYG